MIGQRDLIGCNDYREKEEKMPEDKSMRECENCKCSTDVDVTLEVWTCSACHTENSATKQRCEKCVTKDVCYDKAKDVEGQCSVYSAILKDKGILMRMEHDGECDSCDGHLAAGNLAMSVWHDGTICRDCYSKKQIKPQIPTDVEGVLVEEPTDSISEVLKVRGDRYGVFADNAHTAQKLKRVLESTPNWKVLDDDQKQALEMIVYKMSRVLHGDPDYDDNWLDMAGFSKLVADRLEH
jgi:hypothetical protein